MRGMACGTVNDRRISHVFTIVDHDGPDVDEAEKSDVGEFLKREQEREQVVRYGLSETIKWVESVAGVWCRHDPLVMWLVKTFVDERMMKTSVNEVDQAVGEQEEEREL